MQLKSASHFFFAATMIAIGIIGLIGGTFAPIWVPVPDSVPERQFLSYLCGFVSLAAGAGLLAKRTAAPAALVLLVYLLVWTALFKFPFILRAPLEEGSYQSTGENVVLIAGTWIFYTEAAGKRSPLAGEVARRIALLLYGLALVAFGLSHFFYLSLTAPLVPTWLPGAVFWAYFTGCAYVAAGVAIATGVAARLGAALVATQIALITLLVWGPFVLAGHMSAMHWQETVVSCALTAAAWVVATSFEGRPWFRFGRLMPAAAAASVPG